MEAYERLEQEWGKFAGVENVVACSSGTAALHLALEALRLPPGSEVIVPDYTMVACARAVVLAGLTPVFVDCRNDLLIDPGLVEDYLSGSKILRRGWDYKKEDPTNKPAALMAVHIYGRSCNMPALMDLADKYDLFVIEDLAEAHGLPPHPGTDAACWSFYRNKIVAGEEGGAVAFKDPTAAHTARCLRTLGFTEAHDFYHAPRGHNYRMSNLHARFIFDDLGNRNGLPFYNHNVNTRRSVEMAYDAACPAKWKMPKRDIPWVYDLRVPGMTHMQQALAVGALNDRGIAARHGFKPMHEQLEFGGWCRKVGGEKASRLGSEVIYLPLIPMSMGMIRTCFDVINQAVSGEGSA